MESVFGFQAMNDNSINSVLFSRLAFLYWGSHLAANLVPPVFPILLLLKSENDKILINNFFLTFLIVVNLIAIYLSGNRISWLILTIFLIILLLQYKGSLIPNIKSYIIIITTSFILYIYSQPVEGRYISTYRALVGKIDMKYDSSGGARIMRAKNAISSIINEPFGTGWGSQGWVHSDVLQVASSTGIISGLIFFIVPIFLLYNLHSLFHILLTFLSHYIYKHVKQHSLPTLFLPEYEILLNKLLVFLSFEELSHHLDLLFVLSNHYIDVIWDA